MIFLLITNIVGNSIVLVAVSVAKNRSRMTFFILHLAIAGKNTFLTSATKKIRTLLTDTQVHYVSFVTILLHGTSFEDE